MLLQVIARKANCLAMDLDVIKETAKTWTVLIVDDNIDNLTVASHILEFCDAKVHITRSGDEALTLLEEFDISFVLLDLAMPYVDGWQTFEKIRSNPKTATMPVIAVSAQINDKERTLDMGFTGFIPKPFSMQPFLEAIYEYMIPKPQDFSDATVPADGSATEEASIPSADVATIETATDKEDTPESTS
jgi:CheY-like chemotaxis protein